MKGRDVAPVAKNPKHLAEEKGAYIVVAGRSKLIDHDFASSPNEEAPRARNVQEDIVAVELKVVPARPWCGQGFGNTAATDDHIGCRGVRPGGGN